MYRVAILVTHLSGTGHFIRARALARAVDRRGGRALLLTGGRLLSHFGAPGVAWVQLPPVTVTGFDFATPRRPDGVPADAGWFRARRAAISDALAAFAPHVLVTETWPLGRRRLGDEFEAAVAAAREARADVRLAVSVRDVPEPIRKPARLRDALDRLTSFDAVLVHGEASVLPLWATLPVPEETRPKVRHVGYVGRAMPSLPPRGASVLVSVGGGATGRRLLTLAAEAAERSDLDWRLLVGGVDGRELAAGLMRRRRRARLIAEPVRRDFPRLLAGAGASISLFGYNTATDLAGCRTPALIVPFDEFGEREQSLRAAAFARFPGLARHDLARVSPCRLADLAEQAVAGPRRPVVPLRTDGADRAARALLDLAAGRS